MNNGFNVRDEYKNLTVPELKEIQDKESLPFSVVALNLNGDLNIGMMIRTAALLGASDFYIFGRRKIDRRPLVGVQNYMNIHRVWGLDTNEEIDYLSFQELCKTYKLSPVLVEQGGTPLNEVNWSDYPSPTFVFGNEGDGLPTEFIESDYPKISIPQVGVMRSFNVAAAASIVLWDYVSKTGQVK